jgi:hypothetical protein
MNKNTIGCLFLSLMSFYSIGAYISDDELAWQAKILQRDENDQTKNTIEKQKFLCVSLGFNCTMAFYFNLQQLRRWSFPFDWNISSLQGVCDLIDNHFIDFLNPAYLDQRIGVFNNQYKISFAHDFPEKIGAQNAYSVVDNYLDFLDEIRTKYERRIERFYTVCDLAETVYFFRLGFRYISFDSPGQLKEDVITLRDTLKRVFPQGNWILVAIDISPAYQSDWHIPKVKNFYVSDHGMYSEFIEIFRELGLES